MNKTIKIIMLILALTLDIVFAFGTLDFIIGHKITNDGAYPVIILWFAFLGVMFYKIIAEFEDTVKQ